MGVRQCSVGALHPLQALVECDVADFGIDHRLVSDRDAALVERGDDLVGGAHVLAPYRVELNVGAIGIERALAANAYVGGRKFSRNS
jgi:hypothetical protein